MNLIFVVALAVSFLLAFSIGLNLGLHGVFNLGSYNVAIHNVHEGHESIAEVSATDQKSADSPHPDGERLDSIDKNTDLAAPNDSLKSLQEDESDLKSKSALQVLNDVYEGKTVRDAITAASLGTKKGAIATFLQGGGSIPVVLLTCNRPEQLKGTLSSLLSVRGVSKDNIIVAQDGAMREVAEVVHQNGLQLLQNSAGLNLRGGAGGDGARRIAMHYKYSLSAAFRRMPDAPAIIITEDDLLFSPDFYEYLTATAPILENDPTTFVVSAWNDNGFKGLVEDKNALRRTEFFPGLGWLLPRELYEKELENNWPNQHWDHWLRSEEVHGQRDIIYPEVPRTFHNGIIGTFMNMETHNKYFRDIDYNTDQSVKWDTESGIYLSGGAPSLPIGTPNYITAVDNVDTARVVSLISHCTHVRTFQEIIDATGVVCVWINIEPDPQGRPPEFQNIASFFGIWHEHRRGAHRGLHELHWEGKYVLILNVRDVPGELNYRGEMPPTAVLISPDSFDMSALTEMKRKKFRLEGYPAKQAGMNCDEVCAESGLVCRGDMLPLLNTCQALNEKFPCRTCVPSFGLEQPAYVSPSAEESAGPGTCVISTEPEKSVCGARHRNTLRLCACG